MVVLGGGMTGLSAAEWLRDHAGREVVLLESSFCGGGATGRSSGFITPDSELQVNDLVRRFGAAEARRLWLAAREALDPPAGAVQLRVAGQLRPQAPRVEEDGDPAGP